MSSAFNIATMRPLAPSSYTWMGQAWSAPPTAITLHYAGRFDNATAVCSDNLRDWSWLRAHPTASANDVRKAGVRDTPRSFHIVNGRAEGDVVVFVPLSRVAWHCPTANNHAVGIENVCSKNQTAAPGQLEQLAEVIRQLIMLYPSIRTIGAHRWMSGKEGSTDCPGSFWGADPSKPVQQRAALDAWVRTTFGASYVHVG